MDYNESPLPVLFSPHQKRGPVKLFVGGLTGDITKELLEAYFGCFAKVTEAFVVYAGLRSAGFGFITVKDHDGAEKILQTRHSLNQSVLDVMPALDKIQAKVKQENERKRKIFVGGLPKNFNDDRLRVFFEIFGPIQKCYVVKDPFNGVTRGFGFVIFSTDEGFYSALKNSKVTIGNQEVHVKVATSKGQIKSSTVIANNCSQYPKNSKRKKKTAPDNPILLKSAALDPRKIQSKHRQSHNLNTTPHRDYRQQSPFYENPTVERRKWIRFPPKRPQLTTEISENKRSTNFYYETGFANPQRPGRNPGAQPLFLEDRPVHSANFSASQGLHTHETHKCCSETKIKPIIYQQTKHVYSTEALFHRPTSVGGPIIDTFNMQVSGNSHFSSAKSEQFVETQPRRYLKSGCGFSPQKHSPVNRFQKHAPNPFDVQEEDEEEAPSKLRRFVDL